MNETWQVWTTIGACATAAISALMLIVQFFSLRIQVKRHKGELLFELVYKGDHVGVIVTNTGECIAREITITSNPPLSINFNDKTHYDGCVGTYYSWIIGTTIHELLPHHSLVDENAFPVKDFNIHFANYSTIVVKKGYSIGGKRICDYQTIDVGILRTKRNEEDLRKLKYADMKRTATG